MTKKGYASLKTAVAAALALSPLALSHTALASNPIPGPAELQRLHDVIHANPTPSHVPKEAIPNLSITEEPLPADKAKDVLFTLKSVTVKGVSLYDPQAFMQIFDNVTGHETSVAELFTLAGAITRTYRNDGYILARAFIPPQDITEGHVTLQVIEGKLHNVTLQAASNVSSTEDASHTVPHPAEQFAEAAKADLGDRILHAKDLEGTLLRLNDLPGVTATGTLAPGALPGTSDLVITTTEDDYSGSVGWSNWGTRFLGPRQFEGDITLYNTLMRTFDWYDELTLRALQTSQPEELTYVNGSYKVPLNRYGTTLQMSGTYSRSEPGFTLENLNIKSKNTRGSLTLTQPLTRSRRTNVQFFGTLDWSNSTSASFGNTLNEDQLRVLRFGMNMDHADNWNGITNTKLEISHGLDLADATDTNTTLRSRTRGTGVGFWKARAELARLQRLHTNWNLLLAASGQFSSHALLAGEEFGVGGENFGRGYDVSEILGDHGVSAKAELQVTFPVGWKYLDNWQLFGFYDLGIVYHKDPEAGSLSKTDNLLSNGVGIRTRLTKNASIDVTLANPLTRPVSSQGDNSTNPSLYVRLKKRFGGSWQ